MRSYRPDFLVGNSTVVEVKTFYSLFGDKTKHTYYEEYAYSSTRLKAKATLRAGYNYKLLLMEGDKPLSLPENWFELNRAQLAKHLNFDPSRH
jgi:hypothetical protein